jgi:hypothetical protein
MERRVNTVQLRPINLLTSGQVAAITAGGGDLDSGPDTVVGLNAPNQYRRIIEGYYYSNLLTGAEPKVELYFSAGTGLAKDNTIRVEGIHQLDDNGTAVEVRVSNDYKTLSVDTPPWEERESFNGSRHTPGEDVNNTALFNVDFGNEYSSRKSLIVSREIAFLEATTTTAKLTFTSTNYFKAGDVIYVDMPSTSPYFGLDGLFKVKEAGSNFITYDFPTALEEPINSVGGTDNRSVYAVARSATRDGATWINTSTDPDTIYAWKDIRWITYSTGDVTKDEIAPGPVTELAATSENDTPDGNAVGLSRVTLTWEAPENSADGNPIDDLVGYTIWWRQFATQEWQKADITGADTTFSMSGFQQGSAAYFRVFARDASSNRSTGVDITHTTGRSNPTIAKPKPPTVTTYLGTIKVSYDDLTALGNVQSGTAKEVQVYYSTVSDFDISAPGAYYGKFAAGNNSYIIIPGTELVHNTDYYFKINIRDIYGNVTEASDQVSIRAELEDIVTYNMLEVGSLFGQSITGLQIQTNDNPAVNGGIILNKDQLIAYSPPDNVGGSAAQTFRIDAATGAVSIGEYLGKEEAAGLYLGQSDASTTYSTKVEAQGIEIKATNAQTSANGAQGTANTAITRINAGDITITRSGAVEAINEIADPGNTTTINGGVIKTNTLSALTIKAGSLRSDVVYTGTLDASQINAGSIAAARLTSTSLNADNITSGTIASGRITTNSISAAKIDATNINAGTLTGRTVTTAGSGSRVVMDSGTNRFNVYEGSTLVGSIDGIATTGTTGIQMFASTGSARVLCSEDGTNILASGSRGFNLSNTGEYRIYNATGSTSRGSLTVGSLGYVSTKAYVFTNRDGLLSAQTSTASVSDTRVKTDVADSDLGLNFILELKPVKFKWVNGEDSEEAHRAKYQYGLIAQEVKESLEVDGLYQETSIVQTEADTSSYKKEYPELATALEEDPILSLDYIQLTPVLIKALQEMSNKIDALELEIKLLKDGDK